MLLLKSWSLVCHLQGEHRSHIWEFYNAATNRTGIIFFFPPTVTFVHRSLVFTFSFSVLCRGKANKRFDICVTVPIIRKWAHNEHSLEAGSSACLEIVNIKLATYCKNASRFMYSSCQILIKCLESCSHQYKKMSSPNLTELLSVFTLNTFSTCCLCTLPQLHFTRFLIPIFFKTFSPIAMQQRKLISKPSILKRRTSKEKSLALTLLMKVK